ncbi:MAG: hypothetical protein ACK4VW_06610 [Anaerolineales bacterium]
MQLALLLFALLLTACQPAVPERQFIPQELPRLSATPSALATPMPSPSPTPPSPSPQNIALFTWKSTSPCAFLTVYEDSVTFGECDASPRLLSAPMAGEIQQQVIEWANTYASFEEETPAGKILLQGKGKTIPLPSIVRQMAEWAKKQWETVTSGRAGAAWGVVFTYSRRGGFAGFCDDLVIYATGEAILTSCKGNRELHLRLSNEQLQQIYTWIDQFAAYEFRYADPPRVADGMEITWTFEGRGTQPLDAVTLQEMQEFLSALLSKLYLP